jgi:PAS domain S-box-containing protein
MNAFPVPFRIVVTVLLTCLLVTVGILNLRDRVSLVEPSDGVFWSESPRGLLAREVASDGPGFRSSIRAGDRLISINGQPILNLGQYFELTDGLGINASASYTVASGSNERDLTLELAAKALLLPRDYLRAVLAFLHLSIGLFVIGRGLRLPRAFHFYLICLAAFTVYLYSYTPALAGLDWLVYALSVAAFLLLPALFLHFCICFPVETSGRIGLPLVYFPAVSLGIIHLLFMSGRLAAFGLARTAASSQILDRAHLVYFCAIFLISGAVLLKRRVATSDLVARQQMKWVSYGTLAGVMPFSLIYALPWLLGVRTSFAMESSLLSLALIPLSFAYAVIRYRLLDVEVLVRRGAAYFLASSLLLAAYLAFVLVVGQALQWIAPGANFMAICAGALAIALLFAPIRSRIQSRLDRLFYRGQFDDRASLLEFARTLSSEISLAPLSRSILERIARTFQMKQVALFLADPLHPGFYRLTDALGADLPDALRLYCEDDLVDRDGNQSSFEPDLDSRLRRAHGQWNKSGIHTLQELSLRGRRIGMIGLGQLPHGRHFSTEDLDLLTALAGYAAIALENASLYRSVENKAMELERLKTYTENIIECINVAVLALDTHGLVTSCNRAFEVLHHVQRDRILGAPMQSLFSEDVVVSIHKATGTWGWELKSTSSIFKLYLENRIGTKLIVNMSIIPLLESTDLNNGCLIVMDDITEKVRLEDQLLQAEKLSSIGLLAAGLAHEINTPITGISSYTQMLLKETPEGDNRKPILEKIEKQTFRAAEIVNGLLNFARLNGSQFEDLDVNRLIKESLALLEHQIRQNHIKVEMSLDTTLPCVYGNGGKLQQVFINLFLNARDAMSSGGELNIQTAMNDHMVIVDIRDSGTGISEENIKRIYDPFFTTKGSGKGTGLGLAVTYGIIQEHGGRIFVDSAPGAGTHFRLKLPTRRSFER